MFLLSLRAAKIHSIVTKDAQTLFNRLSNEKFNASLDDRSDQERDTIYLDKFLSHV